MAADSTIRFRPATLRDLDLLQRWDEQPHLMDAKGDDDWGWTHELGLNPDWREQLIAEVDGRSIGFIQIIDPKEEESHYWGDCEANLRAIDIWIGDEEDLSKGFGSQMMGMAIERCFANPNVTAILIDPLESNQGARRFYERIGFEEVGPRKFGEDDCIVYRLERAGWLKSISKKDD